MRRQQKYPETEWFHYYNANPKNRITGDCVTRAIATALEIDYKIAVLLGAVTQMETGYDNATAQGINYMIKGLGWKKMPQPRKKDGTKYTAKEFCKIQQQWLFDETLHGKEWDDGIIISPRIIANVGGHHTVAIMDGKVWDTWNSTRGCIGNYWIKDGGGAIGQ